MSDQNLQNLQDLLGEPFQLNGSYASLWAVDEFLKVLKKNPVWMKHCPWINTYVDDFLENVSQATGVSVAFSSDQLLSPQPLPLQLKATILNHGDQTLEWLLEDFLKNDFSTYDELKPLAKSYLKALLVPPLEETAHQQGHPLLENLKQLYQKQSLIDDFISITLRLSKTQDQQVSLLAGACFFLIHIAPTGPSEARAAKRAAQYFKELPQAIHGEPSERILEVTRMLASSNETPLKGLKETIYLESLNLSNQQKYQEALENMEQLVEAHPENALYVRSRGRLCEKLGRDQYAFDDYNLALRLKPDYWQAYMNRGSYYAKRKKYSHAFNDFKSALNLRPDSSATRENLLSAYFLQLDSQASG